MLTTTSSQTDVPLSLSLATSPHCIYSSVQAKRLPALALQVQRGLDAVLASLSNAQEARSTSPRCGTARSTGHKLELPSLALVIISRYIFPTYLVSAVEEGGVPANAGEESPSTLSPSDEESADDADDGKVEPLADGGILKELVKDGLVKIDWLAFGVKGLDCSSIYVSKDGLAKRG